MTSQLHRVLTLLTKCRWVKSQMGNSQNFRRLSTKSNIDYRSGLLVIGENLLNCLVIVGHNRVLFSFPCCMPGHKACAECLAAVLQIFYFY